MHTSVSGSMTKISFGFSPSSSPVRHLVLGKHFLLWFTLPVCHADYISYSDSRSSVSSMLGHVSILTDDCSPIFVSLVLAPFAESAKLTRTNL